MSENNDLPRWDMTNVFPSLDSEAFAAANENFKQQVNDLEKYLQENSIHPDAELTVTDPAKLAEIIKGFIDQANAAIELGGTIQSYIYAFISTDSFNQQAAKAMSVLQPVMVKAQQLGDVLFKGWLAKLAWEIDTVIAQDEVLKEHSFYLKETIEPVSYTHLTLPTKRIV